MQGRFLLWSNAVIAAGASGCVLRSWQLASASAEMGPPPWSFATGIGAATWLAYTWQRQVKSTRENGLRKDHQHWLKRHQQSLTVVSAVLVPLAAVALAPYAPSPLNTSSLLLIVGLVLAGMLTLFYPGLPGTWGSKYALRRLPRMKLLWIGATWALITAAWPAWVQAGTAPFISWNTGLMMAERGLVIMALTLPFDIRDREWDPPEMRTVPQQWGVLGAKCLAVVMLAAAGAATLAIEGTTATACIGIAIMVPMVAAAGARRMPWYYALLDATLLLDALLILTP